MNLKTERNIAVEKDEYQLITLINIEENNEDSEGFIFYSFSKGLDIHCKDCRLYSPEKQLEKKEKQRDIDKYNIGRNTNTENSIQENRKKIFAKDKLLTIAFRPFCQLYCCADEYSNVDAPAGKNTLTNNTAFININLQIHDFFCLSTNTICDIHFANNTCSIPLYRYTSEGIQQNNITDWALQLFNAHYCPNEPSSPVCYAGSAELREAFRLDIPAVNTITKEAIFYYVYAVLQHPVYRNKYALNLKNEIPCIPLYNHFHQWAAWGKQLMELHNNFTTAYPYTLERTDVVIEPQTGTDLNSFSKPTLIVNKESGEIQIDAYTTLSGIPATVWNFKPGNYCALEWIIEPFKENQAGISPIAEKVKNYQFRLCKEKLINLLQRICTVSIETMKIIEAMP